MNPFQKLAAKAQSARFRFKADVDKGDLIDGEKQTGGLKVMTVVIFVLAAHIVVIGGITAYNLLKGAPKDTAQNGAATPEALAPDADKGDATKPDDAAPKADGADMANANAAAPKDDTTANAAPAATDASSSSSSEAINLSAAPGDNANGNAAPAAETPATPAAAPKPMAQVAPAPTPVAPIAVSGVRQSYVVKSGDNLHKIAVSHGMTVAALKAANGLKSDVIRVGQKLTVIAKGNPAIATASATPASIAVQAAASAAAPTTTTAAVAAPAPAPMVATAAAPAAGSQSYKVAKGDTLTRIAKQFKTSAAAIMAANKLSDPKKLRIGEVLVIPGRSDRREVSSQQAVPATLPNQPSANPDLVMNK